MRMTGTARDGIGMDSKYPTPIRLVLLDDRDVARRQSVARQRKEPQLDIVGDASDGDGAVKLGQTLRPDAVIVETRHMHRGSVEAIAARSTLHGATRPAIVTYLEILHRGNWPTRGRPGPTTVVEGDAICNAGS